MRVRSGWPSKAMPNMSNTSRSRASVPGCTSNSDGHGRRRPRAPAPAAARRSRCGVRDQGDDDLEALGRRCPSGSSAVGLVGEVVDRGDVEAHAEAVVVAQACARGRRSCSRLGCSTRWPRAPGDRHAVHELGLGLGVRRARRRRRSVSSATSAPDRSDGDGLRRRPGRRAARRRARGPRPVGAVSSPVADLLVQREDGVDAASRARAGSPGA